MDIVKCEKPVWSYSVYGENHDMYFKPLIEVILVAKKVGAQVVINTSKNFQNDVLKYFYEYLDNITVLIYEGSIAEKYPKILRFLVSDRVKSEFYFFKDSDSLVGAKEIKVMNHWMNSDDASCMIIRDHPQHVAPILAGMFGLNEKYAIMISKMSNIEFNKFNSLERDAYSYDQDWLRDYFYLLIIKSAHVYTSYLFYSGERIFRISRSRLGESHIGAQSFLSNINEKRPRNWFDLIYGNSLLSMPFSRIINKLLPGFIYGRVRPTLIFSFAFSKVFNKSCSCSVEDGL